MSKKRPGVDAAIQLAKSNDVDTWSRVNEHHDSLIDSKLQDRADQLGVVMQGGRKDSLSKSDLLDTVIPWKFAVGKRRNALLGLLRSNSEADISKWTKEGMAHARTIDGDASEQDITTAVGKITELKGVGPAAASVILSLIRPDIFSYMYDEVIDCFLPKRTYTLKVYITCNAECIRIARSLGGDWTPAKVARTLWAAARVSANGIDVSSDPSNASQETMKAKIKKTVQSPIPTNRASKRRKTK